MDPAVIQWDRLEEAAAACGDRSRYAMSKRTGLSQSVLFRLRHGKGSPSAGTLLKLARAYGLEVNDLLPTVRPTAVPVVAPDPAREPA
ncbi:helix-turn-helix transcriptional regulator [Actinacidiphila sp. DG2A-62]|uniref:helix-turn-helix domain-containing protein n=1 Tax=Actinacidiphila sp. DG2A-62 TaxID=3108821 RepID=UPI002DBD3D9B|nr:helix-turn-helix transcriptional regulator [Actinacidiphila sp. DG2A-62]MEC3995077.1 helix-turn-helix transcriptional regulator [Actinacidiphila sp. DG2A-62]